MGFTQLAPDVELNEYVRVSVGDLTFDTPADICPDCYRERDVATPVVLFMFGSYTYFRDPVTRERLRDVPAGTKILICLQCPWRQEMAPS